MLHFENEDIGTDYLHVRNVGFMLQRQGEDTDPLQYLRELTQNSIEAINKLSNPKGDIVWDYDPEIFAKRGIKKLCIIDNGIGMTGEEIDLYIKGLSSSGGEQALSKNFGVGSKITAGVKNPYGLIYQSWKNGIGYTATFHMEISTGQYGLKLIKRKDGTTGNWDFMGDEYKPDIIKDHGTRVILLGNSLAEDTTLPPPGAKSPAKWIRHFLNTRYARLPENIHIGVNEDWFERAPSFRINGQISYLDSHSMHKGTLPLKGAQAHWWLLKDDLPNRSELEGRGHIAAVYQNELYDLRNGVASRAALLNFGITLGTARVCIYIEPDESRTLCNTARRDLAFDKKPLPWLEWGHEFEEDMPKPLRDFIESLLSRDVESENIENAIRERLGQMANLYQFSHYTAPQENGSRTSKFVAGRNGFLGPASGENINVIVDPPERDKKPHTPTSTQGDFEDASKCSNGPKFPDLPIPHIYWLGKGNDKRVPSHLHDKAAELPRETLLFINEDFRGFQDLVKEVAKNWKDRPGAYPIIKNEVKIWYAQNLVEAILAVQSLNRTTPNKIEITEDYLTAASLPRYNLINNLKRVLSKKLGKMVAGPSVEGPNP